MKKTIIMLGAVVAWVCGVFGATHEGVQLWENGPLWAKTNIGANSPTETGYYFWWGDTLGYKWQNSKWVASDGSVSGYNFSTANCPTHGKTLAQLQSMGAVGEDGNLLPGVARDVAATAGTPAECVTVSWSTVAGADGYTVYRGTTSNPDAAEVVSSVPSVPSVSSVSFDDTTADPGMLYFYWVTATNAVSASEKSAVETGFRSIAAPTGVTATTTSGAAAVTISWQPVPGAVSYRVYRGTKSGEEYAVDIDTTTETTYADESGAANKTYYYSVKAVGASCDSDFSAFVAGSR